MTTFVIVNALLSGLTYGSVFVRRIRRPIHHHLFHVLLLFEVTENVAFAISQVWRLHQDWVRVLIVYEVPLVFGATAIHVVVAIKYILKPLLMIVGILRGLLANGTELRWLNQNVNGI